MYHHQQKITEVGINTDTMEIHNGVPKRILYFIDNDDVFRTSHDIATEKDRIVDSTT